MKDSRDSASTLHGPNTIPFTNVICAEQGATDLPQAHSAEDEELAGCMKVKTEHAARFPPEKQAGGGDGADRKHTTESDVQPTCGDSSMEVAKVWKRGVAASTNAPHNDDEHHQKKASQERSTT